MNGQQNSKGDPSSSFWTEMTKPYCKLMKSTLNITQTQVTVYDPLINAGIQKVFWSIAALGIGLL